MAKEYIESKCSSCSHSDACAAWIRHGSTLYDDFAYSVSDCPHYNPAADVVEVVRCKDCKHSALCGESGQCLHPYGLTVCDGNDFCSCGERRDNDAQTD